MMVDVKTNMNSASRNGHEVILFSIQTSIKNCGLNSVYWF